MMRKTLGLGILIAALLATPALPQAAPTPEAMLGAALHQERVTGNLQAAIDGYRKVLAIKGVSRSVAAQAQYHMGVCYEKLGNREARKAFESVVRNYSDQKDLAAQARVRLAAMSGPGDGGAMRTRLVWDNAIDVWGRVSADGRYLSFVDWDTGDLAVRDLETGENRRVTNKGGYEKALAEAEANSISPDGKRIAFAWDRWDNEARNEGIAYELHIINVDGSGERVLLKEYSYLEPCGWSPDGKWLAAGVEKKPLEYGEILLIGPDTGETRAIPTGTNGWKSKVAFSPDGRWLAYNEQVSEGGRATDVYLVGSSGAAGPAVRLAIQATFLGWTPDGGSVLFRKIVNGVERLYSVLVAQGRATAEPALLPVPSIGEAGPLGLTPAGTLYYSSSNRETETWIMRADLQSGRWSDPVAKLPVILAGWGNNVGNPRFSPDGKSLAVATAGPAITIRGMGNGKERVVTPQLREMNRFEWTPDGASFLVSAISREGKSGLYRVDAASGATDFVCPINPGLNFVVAPDGKSVFHLTPEVLSTIDLATGSERTLLQPNLKDQGPLTLRLSRDGKFLAASSFTYLGVYEIATGTLREIYHRPKAPGRIVSFDWSADGQSLYAVARVDPTARVMEHWIFPASGGEPRRIQLPQRFRSVATSPDGVHVAASRMDSRAQVWALENFLPAAAASKK